MQIPAGRVEELLATILNDPSIPAPVKHTVLAGFWLAQVDAFRLSEEEFMVTGKFESMIDDHRVFLSNLISDGETVLDSVRKMGMALPPTGFTEADLKATLESLYNTMRRQHGPQNSAKTNEGILQLFDVAKPRD